MRRNMPPTSPERVPCAIPANTNTTSRVAPMLAVVAYGPLPLMNQSAWTLGSVAFTKKAKTPPTTQTTASMIHAVSPPMIASNP